jgi:hypothetical protein
MTTQSTHSNGQDEKYNSRKKTYFIDLDGTLLHKPMTTRNEQDWKDQETESCVGAVAWVNTLEKQGHKIILVTARKESHRKATEKLLLKLGFCWDMLIMGCTNGERVVVNDGPCSAMKVKTNDNWYSLGCW